MKSTGIQPAEKPSIVKFRIWLVHLAPLAAFFLPVTPELLIVALASYFVRVFAWEAGSHRYFSHHAFKTTRTFQLILAVLSAAGSQRGPIWWATYHRQHHRHVDQALDPHSPVQRGFWYAHLGWLTDPAKLETDLDAAPDLARFPELVWVNKYHYLFPYILLGGAFALGHWTNIFGNEGMGLSAMVWIFFIPTLIFLHMTCCVNTMAHSNQPGQGRGVFRRRRFNTNDSTVNVWLLAIPTMGAAWHNNHHRYMNSARAGFYRWELDLTYLLLRLLALFRVVWDLHPVPAKVLSEGRQFN